MSIKKSVVLLITVLALIILSSCESHDVAQEPTPQETATMTVTNTISPTVTLTPTQTATVTPTFTFTPTPTPLGGGAGQIIFNGVSNLRTNNRVTNVYLYNFENHQLSLLLSGFSLLDVSPTREIILVSQFDTDRSKSDIYSYDINSETLTLLFEGFDLMDVSPTGMRILISRIDQNSGANIGNLYVANLVDLELTLISSAIDRYASAGWLVSIDSIAFVENVNGTTQLFILDSDGNKFQVTNSSVGVMDFRQEVVNSGIFWEEGYHTRSGSWSHGWRWTELSTLETQRMSDGSQPVVSPDSRFVAMIDRFEDGGLVITDTKSSAMTQVFINDLVTGEPTDVHLFFQSLFWFPDNQHLILFINSCSPECGSFPVILSKEGELLGKFTGDDFYGYEIPQWSPDGTQILVNCELDRICMLDLETMLEVNLPNIQVDEIDWIYHYRWLP